MEGGRPLRNTAAMVPQPSRIALLIDADNADPSSIGQVLRDVASRGSCTVRRAYGDWSAPRLRPWVARLHELAIRPMQQVSLTPRKNATDIAMTIDAVDLWHAAAPDGYALVSSDADFTPLALYLREQGADVHGYGRASTPAPFQHACTTFTVLEPHRPPPDAEGSEGGPAAGVSERRSRAGGTGDTQVGARSARPASSPDPPSLGDRPLVEALRDAVATSCGDDGWAPLGLVGKALRNDPTTDARAAGHGRLTGLLQASGLFELRNERTPHVAVRDRRPDRPT